MAHIAFIDRQRILAGLLFVIAVIHLASAQEPSEERIAQLVQQLGDNSYSTRHQASQRLSSLGEASRTQLELATRSEDAEVALRAQRLLHHLAVEKLWVGSTVTPPNSPVPWIQAIQSISRQSGNPCVPGEGLPTPRNPVIQLDQATGTFWPTLDQICRQSGTSVQLHFDTHRQGFYLLPRPPGDHPIAYAGALRAELAPAPRPLVESLDDRQQESDSDPAFQLLVDMVWESHLQLVACQSQPEVVRAVSASGEPLQKIHQSSAEWKPLDPDNRHFSAVVPLEMPPQSADRLATLVLRWPLIAVGEMTALTVSYPEQGNVYHRNDLALTIDTIRPEKDGTYLVAIRVGRDIIRPEWSDLLLCENRVELSDSQGRLFTFERNSGTLGTETDRIQCIFRPPTKDAIPAMLRLIYPRLRDIRAVEFEFQDVPLR